jgi:TonB-linked SusC/RagA family outer membrane protein
MKGSYTKEDPVGNGSLNQASTSSPMQTIYDPTQPYGLAIVNPYNTIGPNGQPVGRYPGLPINALKGNLRQNWLAFNELNENIVYTGRLVTGLYAEIEPIAGLKVRGNLGIDFILSKNETFGRNDTIYGGNFIFTNSLNRGNQERLNLTKEVIASYTKSFGEHSVSLLAGALDQRFDFWGGGQGAIDVPEERELRMPQNGRFATPQTVPGEMFRDYWALQGYIGRLSYNYKGKYYLDATIRRDGSSRFAPEKRWGTFPSLAAAWRISDEDFFKTIPFVDNLKLRAGWGQLGNQETRDYAYLSLVTIKPDYGIGVGQTPQSAAAITSFANRALGWETSNQTNIGLDASFLDNKITATVDYYIKQTNDILVGVRLPYVSGVPESAIVNAASVRNSGVELELGYQNAIGDFKYGISGNLTTTRNRVTDLGFSDPINATNNRTEVGMPMGYFYGYQTNGIIQDEGELDAYNDEVRADSESPNGASPGDIRFVNNNGPAPEGSPRGVYFSGQPDTVITAADRTYLGKAIPDFYYGFNLNGSWKGLDLGIFFQGVSGFQIYNEVRTGGEDMGGYGNSWTTARNRWTGPFTSNSMPRAVNGDPNGNNRFSDRWVENGSFLRLKNIQLGYTLPRGLLNKMGNMSNLRVYVSATNLALITKYSGLDPEILGGDTRQVGSVLEPGVDRGGTPLPRVLTVGVNAAF